ncbi:4-hydroxy-tetrahydrodipicolinate reductase [soil metagenome]
MPDPHEVTLNIAVFGAAGRLGRETVRAVANSTDCRLSGATVRPGSTGAGRDAGTVAGIPRLGIALTEAPAEAVAEAAVAIDCSTAAAAECHARICREAGCALLVAATGHEAQAREALEAAACAVAVLVAPNLSRGALVLRRLAALAAQALPAHYDVGIVDYHRRGKTDAPSGTALALGESIAGIREQPTGFAAVRAGDIVGEHTVLLAGDGERLELIHRVQDRAAFAAGALAAARWLATQPPGWYGLDALADEELARK